MPDADVYQDGRLVGHLDRTSTGTRLSFLNESDLEDGRLAVHLPWSASPIESADLHPFFLNLLPEGARLLLLLESAKSKDDSFDLLLRTGWDTIGDASILRHGDSFGAHQAGVPERLLREVSFWELFYEGAGENADSAVPGVQEKVSSSTITFGIRSSSSPSAIVKLNPKKYPRLVQNEDFFLRLARHCGIEVNRASLVQDKEGEVGLLVHRFDREKRNGRVARLHQEDACQLLNEAPANKYDLSFRQIAEAVASVCTSPRAELARLIQLYVFSYLIGNGDLHAKNLSVLWKDGLVRLTPGYDILTTLPYKDRSMALKVNGRDSNFRTTDFVTFGKPFGMPEPAIRAGIKHVCGRVESWLDRLSEIGWDEKTTSQLGREIAKRIEQLRR